ncbi:MAG: hypothetical protein DLM66_09840 [Candidatus Dormiibacter spiritus]|nr:MAG: hypothetical protein DLM66_09840 [Candidatus Dormibacteraeota bacterium]
MDAAGREDPGRGVGRLKVEVSVRLRLLLALLALGALAAGGLAYQLISLRSSSAPGTLLVLAAAAQPDRLGPTRISIGAGSFDVSGGVPRAPESAKLKELSVRPGSYELQIPGQPAARKITISSNQVQPLLLAVEGGRVPAGGAYIGDQELNLGLQELGGKLTRPADVSLQDQAGRPLDRSTFTGRDTVVAAFHTNCHQTCPLYTGLLFQLRQAAPDVNLLEVTTDPGTDTSQVLAQYRERIGADWLFATGSQDAIAEFWAPFGIQSSTGDTHTSGLVLIDRHGYVRAAYTGAPDVGGKLPAQLSAELDPAGRELLAGHGEGWGSAQVLEALKTVTASEPSRSGSPAPAFSLAAGDGGSVTLEQFRGRPLILNFWWTGCPPCRQELPALQRFAAQHPETSLLLVDNRESQATASGYLRSIGVRASLALDQDGRVAAAYRVAGFPTTVLVGPDGTIRDQQAGPVNEAALAQALTALH